MTSLTTGPPICKTLSDKILDTHARRAKIRDLRDDAPLVGMFAYIFKLVGLQAPPSAEMMKAILKFTKEKYRHLAPEDLILAFEGAIAEEFKANLDHYQNFSPLYFGTVLNNYVKHRGKILIDEAAKTQTEILNMKTDQQIEEIHKEFIQNAIVNPYEVLLTTGSYQFQMEWRLFETLEKKGIIELTIEEKRKIYDEAKESFLNRVNGPAESYQQKRELVTMADNIREKGLDHYENTISNTAKSIAFRRWITEAANKKVNLKTLLK